MRVVLDANVYVSALISMQGPPNQILLLWLQGDYDLLISTSILGELSRVLRYPKVMSHHGLSEQAVDRFVRRLETHAVVVFPEHNTGTITADPTDNMYLDCAIAGLADVIVSGDRHLLALREHAGISILRPAEFIRLLRWDSMHSFSINEVRASYEG